MNDLIKSPYSNDGGRGPVDMFGNSRTTEYGFKNYKYSGPEEGKPTSVYSVLQLLCWNML